MSRIRSYGEFKNLHLVSLLRDIVWEGFYILFLNIHSLSLCLRAPGCGFLLLFFFFGCAGSLCHVGFSSCPVACGILVSGPGIEHSSPALEGGFLTTGPPGKSPAWC